jgi:hypothetical protein
MVGLVEGRFVGIEVGVRVGNGEGREEGRKVLNINCVLCVTRSALLLLEHYGNSNCDVMYFHI